MLCRRVQQDLVGKVDRSLIEKSRLSRILQGYTATRQRKKSMQVTGMSWKKCENIFCHQNNVKCYLAERHNRHFTQKKTKTNHAIFQKVGGGIEKSYGIHLEKCTMIILEYLYMWKVCEGEASWMIRDRRFQLGCYITFTYVDMLTQKRRFSFSGVVFLLWLVEHLNMQWTGDLQWEAQDTKETHIRRRTETAVLVRWGIMCKVVFMQDGKEGARTSRRESLLTCGLDDGPPLLFCWLALKQDNVNDSASKDAATFSVILSLQWANFKLLFFQSCKF